MIFKINNDRDKLPVIDYIKKLPEKNYIVKVSLKRRKRTINQNALYWLWLTCIADETGNDKDILHYAFREMYLPKKSGTIANEIIEIPISTTVLETKQFGEYLDQVKVFASSELGIILPDPNDLNWDNFYETYNDRI